MISKDFDRIVPISLTNHEQFMTNVFNKNQLRTVGTHTLP